MIYVDCEMIMNSKELCSIFINLFNKKKKIQKVQNNENYLLKGIIENIFYYTCPVPCGLLGEDKYIIEINPESYKQLLLEFDTQEEQTKTVYKLKEKMNGI